ncbi:MAG: hypothetical protein KJ811_04895, partial [Candidatus Margulisbacteria bacterium]|nr:hypothetical protein [Candidatus Margulisiibacteriota bacterium]
MLIGKPRLNQRNFRLGDPATWNSLGARCVTSSTHRTPDRTPIGNTKNPGYFEKYMERKEQILNWLIETGKIEPRDLLDPVSDSGKERFDRAIAILNSFSSPGKIHRVNPEPKPGMPSLNPFFQRIIDPLAGEEKLRISNDEKDDITFSDAKRNEVHEDICAGKRALNLQVGGLGKRLDMERAKWIITPQDLIDKYRDKEHELGIMNSEPPKYQWTVGERLMLSLAFGVFEAAEAIGQDPFKALKNQTIFVTTSAADAKVIEATFKQWDYFGLDRNKVFFMSSTPYPTVKPRLEGGSIKLEETDHKEIHNHGVAVLQMFIEGAWHRHDDKGRDQEVSRENFIKMMTEKHPELRTDLPALSIMQTYPIETMDIHLAGQRIDPGQLALMQGSYFKGDGVGERKVQEQLAQGRSIGMTMTMVGQKPGKQAQKGGVLALDPAFADAENALDDLIAAIICIEAFQAVPKFHDFIKGKAKIAHQKIKHLNLNANTYGPKEVADWMINYGLPVWFAEAKAGPGEFKNESPQGDLNYFLRTIYTALYHVKGTELVNPPINNLKEPLDIPSSLRIMWLQEQNPKFILFAKSIDPGENADTRARNKARLKPLKRTFRFTPHEQITIYEQFRNYQTNPIRAAKRAEVLEQMAAQAYSDNPYSSEARQLISGVCHDPIVTQIVGQGEINLALISTTGDPDATIIVLRAIIMNSGKKQANLARKALGQIAEAKKDENERAQRTHLAIQALKGNGDAAAQLKKILPADFQLKSAIPTFDQEGNCIASGQVLLALKNLINNNIITDRSAAQDVLGTMAIYPHQFQKLAQQAYNKNFSAFQAAKPELESDPAPLPNQRPFIENAIVLRNEKNIKKRPALTKLAAAGTIGGLVAVASTSIGAAGLAVLGLAVYTKHMFAFDKSMQKRNANPGDFTFIKQMATFASLTAAPLLIGSGMVYFAATLLPFAVAPTFGVLAGAGVVYGLIQATRGAIKSKKVADQTITQGYKAGGWRQIIETNFHSYAVQGTEGAYTFYRGATLSVLFYQIAGDAFSTIVGAGLAGAGSGVLMVGIPLFLLISSYCRIVSKRRNELQTDYGFLFDMKSSQGRRNILIAAVGCAAAGALLPSLAPLAITAIAALAFFTAESHGFVHNFVAQRSSREVIHKAPNEYPETEIWQASQRPDSPWITILKPRFLMDEFFVFCIGTLFMREGTNWDFLNIFSTSGHHKDLAVEKECKRFYREKQQAILDIVLGFKDRIQKEPKLANKYLLLSKMYTAMAEHWEKESEGDFSNFSIPGNKHSGQRSVFASEKANNLEKYVGKLIKYKAKKFRAEAEKLRSRRYNTSSLSEEEIAEKLECLELQYSAIFHTFCSNMHRNVTYDSKRSKIRKVDFYNMLVATFKTGGSILKRNRNTGKFYWEILPCRRIRKLDQKTNTLNWVDRDDTEMTETITNLGRIQRLGGVETYSEVAYIDNRGMSDPKGAVHTEEAYTYDNMKPGEFQTIVFKDGRQQTFHADGRVTWQTANGRDFIPNGTKPEIIETQKNNKGETVRLYDNGTKEVYDTAGNLKTTIEADEVVWIPGMRLPAELEKDLPAKFRGPDGKVHEDVVRPTLTHFFESKYQTMLDGEHVDITLSHYLARLEDDLKTPYVTAMYKVPEKVSVPSAMHLRETPGSDRLVRVHGSLTPFMIRVKEKGDDREFYLPYNFKKSALFSDDFWAHVTGVKLMTRKDFKDNYGVAATDNRGDRHPCVIVPIDADGNRIRTLSAKALMGCVEGKDAFEKAANAHKLFKQLVKWGYLKHVSGEAEVSVGIIQPALDNALTNQSLAMKPTKALTTVLTKAANSGQVMPYSFHLKSPKKYESIEFDRGLGRCGDRHMVAYTFEREDGSSYMRWLPKPGDADWPEIDFTEKHQRHEVKGDQIIVHACRWIGKTFSFDKHRLGIDAGTHDNPN